MHFAYGFCTLSSQSGTEEALRSLYSNKQLGSNKMFVRYIRSVIIWNNVGRSCVVFLPYWPVFVSGGSALGNLGGRYARFMQFSV